MPDIVSPSVRSRMMSGIRGKNTKPEMLLRRTLHADGFRFRLHDKNLPGRPDLVFPRYKAVILVHGCFWHAHRGCKYFKVPATRRAFWSAKFEANEARDRRAVSGLRDLGWRVAIVWECAMRRDPSGTGSVVAAWLATEESMLIVPDQVQDA